MARRLFVWLLAVLLLVATPTALVEEQQSNAAQLNQWFDQTGIIADGVQFVQSQLAGGVVLQAVAPLPKFHEILQYPVAIIISPFTAYQTTKGSLRAQVQALDDTSALIVGLILHKALGPQSKWHGYLASLSPQDVTSLPAHYGDNHLQMLKSPKETQYALSMRQFYSSLFEKLQVLLSRVLAQHGVPVQQAARALKPSGFLWAMGMIESRARIFRGSRCIFPGMEFAEVAFPDHFAPAAAASKVAQLPLAIRGSSSDDGDLVSFIAMSKHEIHQRVLDVSEQFMPSWLRLQHLGHLGVLNGGRADCEPVTINVFPNALQGPKGPAAGQSKLRRAWSRTAQLLALPQSDVQLCVGSTGAIHPAQGLAVTLATATEPELSACISTVESLERQIDSAGSGGANLRRGVLEHACYKAAQKAGPDLLPPHGSQHEAYMLSPTAAAYISRRINAQLRRFNTSLSDDVPLAVAAGMCRGGTHLLTHAPCKPDLHTQGAILRRIHKRRTLVGAIDHLATFVGNASPSISQASYPSPDLTVQVQSLIARVASVLNGALSFSLPEMPGASVQATFRRVHAQHVQWLGVLHPPHPKTRERNTTRLQVQEAYLYKLHAIAGVVHAPPARGMGIVSSVSDLLSAWELPGTEPPNRSLWQHAFHCFDQSVHQDVAGVVTCVLDVALLAVHAAEECSKHGVAAQCVSAELDMAAVTRIFLDVWGETMSYAGYAAVVDGLLAAWLCSPKHTEPWSSAVAKEHFVERYSIQIGGAPHFTLLSLLAFECAGAVDASAEIHLRTAAPSIVYQQRLQGEHAPQGMLLPLGEQPLQLYVKRAHEVEAGVELRLATEMRHPGLSKLAARLWAAATPVLGSITFRVPANSNHSQLTGILNDSLQMSGGVAQSPGLLHSAAWRHHDFEAYLHYLATHQQLTTSGSTLQCHSTLMALRVRLVRALHSNASQSAPCQAALGHSAKETSKQPAQILLTQDSNRAMSHQPAICVLPPQGCKFDSAAATKEPMFKEEVDNEYCVVCSDTIGAATRDRAIII